MGGEACQPGCACVPERKERRERQKKQREQGISVNLKKMYIKEMFQLICDNGFGQVTGKALS